MKTLLCALLTSFLCVFATNNHAQTKRITVPLLSGPIYTSTVHQGYVYFFTGRDYGSRNDFYRMNLSNDSLELIESNILNCQSVKFSDSGVFYITFRYLPNGNDGEHLLNYNPYSRQSKSIKVINNSNSNFRYSPFLPQIIDNKFCVIGFFGNKFVVWESDGSDNGTKIVFSYSVRLENFFKFKNKYYAIVYQNNTRSLINTIGTGLIENINSQLFHTNDSSLLFIKNNKLCISNDLDKIDSVSLAPFQNALQDIVYNDDSILYGTYSPTNSNRNIMTYRMHIKKPYAFDTFPLSSDFKALGYYITYPTSNEKTKGNKNPYRIFWSFNTGFELMTIPKGDSIQILADFNAGYNHSVFPNYPYNYHYQNNTLYIGANNGSTSTGYLYSIKDTKFTCHFPLAFNLDASQKWVYNNTYFWTYSNNDTAYIFHRNLNDKDTQILPGPVKPSKSETDEWHRHAAVVYKTTPSQSYINCMRAADLKVDANDNCIAMGIVIEYGNVIRYSDTVLTKDINGNLLLIKYDPYGRVLWTASLGEVGTNILVYRPSFVIDNEGDILVFSQFFQLALVDTNRYTADRSAMLLVKIDGKTGLSKWVKTFNPQFYTNHHSCDGIVCDKDNNIYLSLTYNNFEASFGSIQLVADRSPVNAIAKLNTDGDFLWAKNTATDWINIPGNSRSFSYDEKENKLYNLISQGYYNSTASCNYVGFQSILQQINTDGKILQTAEIVGDDLNAAICAIPTDNKLVFVSGFYRSALSMFKTTVRSNKNATCYWHEHFTSTINTSTMHPSGLHSSEFNPFYPLDICKDENFIYVLGSEKNPKTNSSVLCIRKFTHLGKIIAKRYFTAYTRSVFDFNFYFTFDVYGDYFYLGMENSSQIAPYKNFVTNALGLSVYKLYKDNDWITESSFEPKQESSGVVVAPNPTHDHIRLQFLEEVQYNSFQLIDVLGRTVFETTITEDLYQTIQFDSIPSGFYTLVLLGDGKKYTQSLIVD